MTTIAEKQADFATIIDDLAGAAINHSSGNWSDADQDIVNDGSSDDWRGNGRVLHHSPSGQYLLLHIMSNDAGFSDRYPNKKVKGVRVLISNDWDSDGSHPAGYTTSNGKDLMSGDIGNNRGASYSHQGKSVGNDNGLSGIWCINSDSGGLVENRTENATYFASVGADYMNIGAWNSTDGNNGIASVYSWEYVDNKFWDDGQDPWAFMYMSNQGDSSAACGYSWSGFEANANGINREHPYHVKKMIFDGGDWGNINPDSNDDTFFFRRPVAYQTHQKNVPVAYMENIISNDREEGAAHGDQITFNGKTYQAFRQSGASDDTTLTTALRYE